MGRNDLLIRTFLNTVARFLFRLDFNVLGVIHLFERQFADAIRKGRGEQHVQALSGRRHAAEQPADIFNKAEIVHAIGFVQHDNLNGAEVNVVLLRVIDQTTSGADQNIDAAFQHFQLLIVAVAAVSQTQLQTGGLRQWLSVGVDLYRQFTRRRHNQRARLVNLAIGDSRVREKIMKR
ncbi:Uncharacterised protein [Klebsiella pneumoniae]|nr:Uncharacterised protein [Klebsiella pneumoniae]